MGALNFGWCHLAMQLPVRQPGYVTMQAAFENEAANCMVKL